MLRTLAACCATAAATAALTSGVGLGSGSATHVKTIAVGETAIFAGQDLLCVNEQVGDSAHSGQAGVACSSSASPYRGVGLWLTRTTLRITRPPNARVLSTLRR
jgi:hypothetical protein